MVHILYLCVFVLVVQQRRLRAQRLLSLATEALTEGVSLGLQHNMLPSLLAEACMNILACVGPSDPAVTGQYLALFQVKGIISHNMCIIHVLYCTLRYVLLFNIIYIAVPLCST